MHLPKARYLLGMLVVSAVSAQPVVITATYLVMPCYFSVTPACASANVSISPWIVYAPWGPSSGPSMRRTSQGELRSVTVTPGGHRDSEH